METKFQIFKPDGKKRISPSRILFGIYFTFMLFSFIDRYLLNDRFEDIETSLSIVMVAILVIGILIKIRSYFVVQPLHGKLEGDLILSESGISMGDAYWPVAEIKKIEFIIRDYYKKTDDKNGLFATGLSNGTDNSFILTLQNGQEISTFFQLKHADEMASSRAIFANYHKLDILSIQQISNLLGLRNYEQVQKFRQEVLVES